MSDEAMLPICRYCGVKMVFSEFVTDEWAHLHGSIFCRDANWKYTLSPVVKGEPTVFALPPGRIRPRVTR